MGVRAGSLVARVVFAAVLAVVLLIASTALAIWWTARQDSTPDSDAIVVLGSAQYNGVPSSIFEARLEHAIALYEDGVAPVIVTVGGKADGDQFTEAEAGRDYLAGSGIPAEALLAVPGGRATRWRASGRCRPRSPSRAGRSAVLVSDPWHAMRAERMAEDAGLDADSSPDPAGPGRADPHHAVPLHPPRDGGLPALPRDRRERRRRARDRLREGSGARTGQGRLRRHARRVCCRCSATASVVATLRASNWKEAATAVVGDREWVLRQEQAAS